MVKGSKPFWPAFELFIILELHKQVSKEGSKALLQKTDHNNAVVLQEILQKI
ncbi:MAG TPA: hypothetical protein VFM64_01515 [Candidatus Nitrosotenuis sp.]|nr:hypothetical protein [Candidatus Nitrosotenuis sp.]